MLPRPGANAIPPSPIPIQHARHQHSTHHGKSERKNEAAVDHFCYTSTISTRRHDMAKKPKKVSPKPYAGGGTPTSPPPPPPPPTPTR